MKTTLAPNNTINSLRNTIKLAQIRANGTITRDSERAFTTLYKYLLSDMFAALLNKAPILKTVDRAVVEEEIARHFVISLRKFSLRKFDTDFSEDDLKDCLLRWIFKKNLRMGNFYQETHKWAQVLPLDHCANQFTTNFIEQQKEVQLCESHAVRLLLPTLPRDTKELLLARAQGQKFGDIAKRLSKKESALKVKMHRLKTQMKIHIQMAVEGKL